MKAVELFAGAGGLAMGVAGAGFKTVAAVEWNRYCCDTIRENQNRGLRPLTRWPLLEKDVRTMNFRGLKSGVEFVSGGPPCQPFSLGGRHRGRDDHRDMFPQAVRAIRELRPRAFLFENVKGLTRRAFGNYFESIRLQLTHPDLTRKTDETWASHLARLQAHHTRGGRGNPDYRVVTQVLNAADFGVPQRRERVFFVGVRADLEVQWSFPRPTHSSAALLWDQAQTGDYWERHAIARAERAVLDKPRGRHKVPLEKPTTFPWRTVRDAIADLPDPQQEPEAAALYANHCFQTGARAYAGHTGSCLDEPAKTLKAGVHGVPGGENMLLRPDGSVRYFTVRESARLQTFPDSFVFHGSWSETMRQLGNAVPVTLARLLARDIRQALTSSFLSPLRCCSGQA